MSDKNIKTLVYSALFTALVTVATAYLKIPTAIGYLNLGDGFIFAAGVVLGPIAAVVGGIGSMIADLMAGYMIYAPITLLIKGCMGLMIGLAARSYSFSSVWKNALMFLAAEAVMVCGYFLFEAVVYGAAAAAGSVVPNLIQAAFGIAIGLITAPALHRFFSLQKAHKQQ